MVNRSRVCMGRKGVRGCSDGMKCSETGMNGIAPVAELYDVSERDGLLPWVMICNQMRPGPHMNGKLMKFCHA